MQLNKIIFSLLIYIFYGRGLKGRAGCRQTEVLKTARGQKRQFWCYYSGADSACGLSACGLDRSAYGLTTSVSMQLWAWPSNLCIEPLQKLLYQI